MTFNTRSKIRPAAYTKRLSFYNESLLLVSSAKIPYPTRFFLMMRLMFTENFGFSRVKRCTTYRFLTCRTKEKAISSRSTNENQRLTFASLIDELNKPIIFRLVLFISSTLFFLSLQVESKQLWVIQIPKSIFVLLLFN